MVYKIKVIEEVMHIVGATTREIQTITFDDPFINPSTFDPHLQLDHTFHFGSDDNVVQRKLTFIYDYGD